MSTSTISWRPIYESGPAFTMRMSRLDYGRLLHPRGDGNGLAIFGRQKMGRKLGVNGKPELFWEDRGHSPFALAIKEPDIREDRFVSFARFRYPEKGCRKIGKAEADIVSIGANWIDLDYYKVPALAEVPVSQIIEAILNRCDDLSWPAPTAINRSGQGLLIYWLFPSIPASALPRWKAVQQTVNDLFKDLGRDPSGLTPTKVFRIIGTYNERSKSKVEMAWPYLEGDIRKTNFDELAAAVLPHSRQKAKARSKAKAEAKAAAQPKVRAKRVVAPGAGKTTASTYWSTFRDDLARLFALRHGEGSVPDGKGRDFWAFIETCVAANLLPGGEALDHFVAENAERWDLTVKEAFARTSAVRHRAIKAIAGIKSTWNDQERDPRYLLSPKFARDMLEITTLEMRKAGLRMLVDEATRKALAHGRVVKSRRAKGVEANSDKQDRRLAIGKQALGLRQQGLLLVQIAERLSVTKRYLDTAIRDAKAVESIKTPKSKKAAVRKTSHVVTPPAEAPKQPENVASYTVTDCVISQTALVLCSPESYSVLVPVRGTHLSDDRSPLSATRPGGLRRFGTYIPDWSEIFDFDLEPAPA